MFYKYLKMGELVAEVCNPDCWGFWFPQNLLQETLKGR